MENNKKLTYEKLLKETVSFYSKDVNKRGINSNTGECVYLDKNTGNKCAVGRCIDHTILNGYEGDFNNIVQELEVQFEYLLLPRYKHLTHKSFWNDLQMLHDSNNNWNKYGLSELGKDHFTLLLEVARSLDKKEDNG